MCPIPEIALDKRFVARIKAQFPEEAPGFLDALGEASAVSIFLNQRKCRSELFDSANQVPWCDAGRFLPERPSFTFDPHFHAGCYYVMESSSMFLSHIIQEGTTADKALCVLDLCAAPGGKSAILLATLPEGSLVVTNEVIRPRWSILQHNLDKWGTPNVVSLSKDPSRLPWSEQFDLIVVDAPCSGEGLFRKDHEARTQWSPENIALCSARQRRILHEAVRMLKPGGQIVYSTCTFNDEENIDQVCRLSDTYRLESKQFNLPPEWGVVVVEKDENIGYQFLPHKVQGEGFFCAVLTKPDARNNPATKGRETKPGSDKNALLSGLPEWLGISRDMPDIWLLKNSKSIISLLQSAINPGFLESISGLRYGTEVGYGKGNTFTPAHALALSVLLKSDLPAIELDETQSISYLRKEQIGIAPTQSGWHLVRYNGYNLGWAKQTGAGVKNYFPTHLRIRQAG